MEKVIKLWPAHTVWAQYEFIPRMQNTISNNVRICKDTLHRHVAQALREISSCVWKLKSLSICLVLTLYSCIAVITRDCLFGLCTHGWFNVIVIVPPALRRYPNMLSSVEPLKHNGLHVSTQSTSETSRTCAVQTHRFSRVGKLFFLTWTHIWRRWDYTNTGLLRPWICPDKNILAFHPLP